MVIRAKDLIYFQIVYNLCIKFVIQAFSLPSLLNYVTDAVIILLLLIMLQGRVNDHVQNRNRFQRQYLFHTFAFMWIFWSIVSYIVNQYNPILYLWGIRNNFRYVVFTVACCRYLDKDDIEKIFSIIFKFFCVNIVVLTYQTFILNIRYDYAAGLFGAGEAIGGITELNVLVVMTLSIYTVKYLSKTEPFWKMAVSIVGALYIAAIGELKIVYLEVAMALLLVLFITRHSLKKLPLILLGTVFLIVSISYLETLYPAWSGFFSWDEIERYLNMGYGSKTAISRGGAIRFVVTNFFNKPSEYIFGIGLGNADYSSNYAFLQSAFNRRYEYTNYHFIQSAFTLIEVGFVGFGLYVAMLLSPAIYSFHIKRTTRTTQSDDNMLTIVILMTFFALVMLFYNVALRREGMAYTYYFFFAIPSILQNNRTSKTIKSNGSLKLQCSNE